MNKFHAALYQANLLYGIELNSDKFEEIAKAEAWKGWIKAMIFIILTDSWITEGSSVYRPVILGPKKKNNNPKNESSPIPK